jgi:hypothetical protein
MAKNKQGSYKRHWATKDGIPTFDTSGTVTAPANKGSFRRKRRQNPMGKKRSWKRM